MRKVDEKKVSRRMVKNLASKLYHADRRRNITAIAAIALSSMLIIMALSAILSIESAMRRSRQMLVGTKAEGVYTFLSYNWFEALRDSVPIHLKIAAHEYSLDLDALLSMFNLFADIEIAADDYLFGLEQGQAGGIVAIPDTVRVELEKIPENVETVYHYQLEVPVVFYGEDAERYCKTVLDSESYQKNVADDEWLNQRMVGDARAYREKRKSFVLQYDYFRFYEYDQIADFKVFEGSLDRDKFESGEYVLAVALDGDGNSLYHAGDVVELADEFPKIEEYSFERDENGRFPYVDSLQKKEYTVMAVVSDAYRNQMVWGDENTTGFEYILPTQLMESFDRTPDLFLVTIDTPDAETLERVERYVKRCLEKVSGIAERREEFSTLQAIGMMRRLLLKVLRLENLYTVMLAVLPGYLIGQFLSVAAIGKASENIPYLRCRLSLLPGILLVVLIGALSIVYPNRRTDIGDKRRER